MIRVQDHAFEVGHELAQFRARHGVDGAMALFVGSVRDMSEGRAVAAMTLEHYPGMTEGALAAIADEARARWPLTGLLVIHRFGRLLPGEDIVLVITAAPHREEAFSACQFLMDWLKTRAPFWKLEEGSDGPRWVEAKASDDDAARRWIERP